jgi:hypothetical protein
MFGIREVWVTRHGLCWSPIPRLARDRRGSFAVYSTLVAHDFYTRLAEIFSEGTNDDL